MPSKIFGIANSNNRKFTWRTFYRQLYSTVYRKIEKHPAQIMKNNPRFGDVHEMKLNKNDEQVVAALKEKDMTLAELAEKTTIPSKKVFKSLKKLFEHEMIDSNARKYRLLKEKPPAEKASSDDEPPEEE
jgi:predicted HTH transcriptional regulator